MPVAKTKALISFAVTVKLICIFVFAYADCWFSHAAAHLDLHVLINSKRKSIPLTWYNNLFLLQNNA